MRSHAPKRNFEAGDAGYKGSGITRELDRFQNISSKFEGFGKLTIRANPAKSHGSNNSPKWGIDVFNFEEFYVAIERMREIRRRRSRRKKLGILKRKAMKANASEKTAIAAKLRKLTPGADVIIANLGLEAR